MAATGTLFDAGAALKPRLQNGTGLQRHVKFKHGPVMNAVRAVEFGMTAAIAIAP